MSAAQRDRLRALEDNPWFAWGAALVVTALAFAMRRWRLGEPHAFAFDETYYAKDAWSLVHHGHVRAYVEGADASILEGTTTGIWQDVPSMVVHPEVGKWIIAAGIELFGMDPAGWRMSTVTIGSLMVLLMIRLIRRVTGSTLLGLVGGLVLAFDGLHFVMSRLALLDIILTFFTLAGVHCVVADRQWLRARLESGVAMTGTQVLWRPWLLLGGLSFGLAVGTKWSALYVLAVFGVMAWLWSAGARKAAGQPKPLLRSIVLDGMPAFLALVGVALMVYLASWSGWLAHAQDYEKAYSNTQYTTHDGGEAWPTASEPDAEGLGEVSQSLRSLWSYHQDVYTFHSHFLNEATHPYQSGPKSWLVMGRPVGVAAELDIQPGDQGCRAEAGSTCLRQVLLLGNPAVWWAGSLALVLSLVMWVAARDWRHGVAVLGTAVTWLPWFLYDERPIFSFYAVTTLPFMVLSLALLVGHLLGTATTPTWRRTAGAAVAGTWFVLVLVAFAWFWPVWTNQLITHSEWMSRMWFDRWI